MTSPTHIHNTSSVQNFKSRMMPPAFKGNLRSSNVVQKRPLKDISCRTSKPSSLPLDDVEVIF